MFTLRYTNDLYVLNTQDDDFDELIRQGNRSDYKVHIINTDTNEIVWQNSPSCRYGDVGVNH